MAPDPHSYLVRLESVQQLHSWGLYWPEDTLLPDRAAMEDRGAPSTSESSWSVVPIGREALLLGGWFGVAGRAFQAVSVTASLPWLRRVRW